MGAHVMHELADTEADNTEPLVHMLEDDAAPSVRRYPRTTSGVDAAFRDSDYSDPLFRPYPRRARWLGARASIGLLDWLAARKLWQWVLMGTLGGALAALIKLQVLA